jgi:hypothetical protein
MRILIGVAPQRSSIGYSQRSFSRSAQLVRLAYMQQLTEPGFEAGRISTCVNVYENIPGNAALRCDSPMQIGSEYGVVNQIKLGRCGFLISRKGMDLGHYHILAKERIAN